MISGKWFVDLLPVAAMALWPNGSLAAQQGASISTVSDLQTRFEQAYTSEEQAIFYPVGDTNTVFHVTFGATSFSTNLFQDWISNGWPVISLASGITGYPVFFQEQIVSNDRIRFLTGLNDFPLPCWTNNWDVNSWIQSAYGEVPYWENAETWRALRDPSRLHYSMTLVPVDMYEAWQELITQTSAAYVVNNEVPADCTNSLYIVSCPGQTPPFRLYMPPGSTNADLFSTMELVPTDWSLKNTLYNPGPYSQLFINESLAHEYLQAADADMDTDHDGLSDAREDLIYGTRNDLSDTDGDGILDGVEILSFGLDPLDADCDDDGVSDGDEVYLHGTGPNSSDTDNDGMPDNWDLLYGTNPNLNDAMNDEDGDTLKNIEEYGLSTDPNTVDSDGDGLADHEELTVFYSAPSLFTRYAYLISDTNNLCEDGSYAVSAGTYGTGQPCPNGSVRVWKRSWPLTHTEDCLISRSFYLAGRPVSAGLSISVDNDGAAYINSGSIWDRWGGWASGNYCLSVQNVSVPITRFLDDAVNTISVHGENSPYASCGSKTTITNININPCWIAYKLEMDMGTLNTRIDINGTTSDNDDLVVLSNTVSATASLIGPAGRSASVVFTIEPSSSARVTPRRVIMETGIPVALTITGLRTSASIDDTRIIAHIAAETSSTNEFTVIKVDTETVATIPADRTRKKVGVGEEVELTLEPSSLSPVTWSISGDGMLSATTGNPVTFTAHDQASVPTVTATYGGTPCAVTFNVVEPSHETAVKQGPGYTYPPGVQGAGMYLEVTVHPTDVSFANVEFREVSGPATGHTGYFANYPAGQPYHSAGVWQLLSYDNKWYDDAAFSTLPSPWSAGRFQWVIPMEWRVIGSSQIGNLPDRVQVFTIHGTNGMSTVSKLGQSATRTP